MTANQPHETPETRFLLNAEGVRVVRAVLSHFLATAKGIPQEPPTPALVEQARRMFLELDR